jgi:hypothetical protein
MIILDDKTIKDRLAQCDQCSILFRCLDDGDVYSMLQETAVPGSLAIVSDVDRIVVPEFGNEDDRVRVALEKLAFNKKRETGLPYDFKGWSHRDSSWMSEEIECVSLQGQLFSRFRGILETDVLTGKTVLVIGIGSFGSDAIALLTKSGVTSRWAVSRPRP